MNKILYGILVSLVVLSLIFVAGYNDSEDETEWHRQHHIEMHGNDDDFEEVHKTCESVHRNNHDMQHNAIMRGGKNE